MMGDSKYSTRTDLLHAKKTGETPPISKSTQIIFDRGHETEASIRPHIEKLLGEELYPVTATSEDCADLLASFDGINMLETIVFEHKLWNEDLAESVRAEKLPLHYVWQLEQQLLVSGAEKAVFVVSDGTPEKMVHMDYYPQPGMAMKLLQGWDQFSIDLDEFTPKPKVEKITPAAIDNLPSLIVEITGAIKKTNLAQYRQGAFAFIDQINTTLRTDEDFSTAESTVKFCTHTEKMLDKVKHKALSQAPDIETFFATLEEIKAAVREKRLVLDKLIKTQKSTIKTVLIIAANTALDNHIELLEKQIHPELLPHSVFDFSAIIKGKRNLLSMQDACDTALANEKIRLNNLVGEILEQQELKALEPVVEPETTEKQAVFIAGQMIKPIFFPPAWSDIFPADELHELEYDSAGNQYQLEAVIRRTIIINA